VNALYLALAYLSHHRWRTLVLVLVAALILVVPVATRALVSAGEAALTARAEATPLLLGRRGSALDLSMAALYFTDAEPDPLPMAEVDAIWDTGLATPIPLNTAFEASGFRIVGTTLDYLDFRGLELAEGRGLALLGEAVVGAAVAEALGVGPGDSLVSSPENLFDLDGVYPLEMPVVGVLAPTGTPDDEAVFVDIKTTWVIAGIGHGHEDVVSEVDAAGGSVLAAASVVQYQRITPENVESFHFHGDDGDFPVTAALVVPEDERSELILRGRFLDAERPVQLVVPGEVVGDLVARIFRIRALLDWVTAIVAAAALVAVALAIFLSWRLRAGEMDTAVKLGARRGTILRLLVAETAVILFLSACIVAAAAVILQANAPEWARWLVALGS